MILSAEEIESATALPSFSHHFVSPVEAFWAAERSPFPEKLR